MTRISFLMPTFNRAHFISESVRSITSQMGDHDELIVIDDGSSDDTVAVLDALEDRFDYYRQENSGKSAALNYAMSLAQGDLIWVCDDDDVLCDGAVGKLTACLNQSGADFVFGRYTRFTDVNGTQADLGTGYWPDLSQGSFTRHILEDSFVMHNASLVRRSAYEQVGPFDETMLRSLDYDMFVRLAVQTRCAYADEVVFQQRKHSGARGPASVLHSADKSENVWKEFDRRIFQRLRAETDIAFFEKMYEANDRLIVRRAALLQRAAIMARHDLWADALTDLEEAAEAEDLPLSKIEIAICRRAVAGKHGFSGALEPTVFARIKALLTRGGTGGKIVQAVLDGLIWRLRDGNAEHRRDARAMIVRLYGFAGIPRLLWRRLSGQSNAVSEAPNVTEAGHVLP